ncbi:hypothetical protein GWK08_05320 [Leptobacterium flavescens]|uniref:RHS repeat protein n=1 Tax=Leptobacterium flavescens TaxID=472055 RepID=A0A6P0UKB4_9FLAO|nr:RHS repeat domain-containing protein [Leptobacterium flavescens]NER12850.1 hypothetical protein [Leptobacterium flavescens]
MKAKLYLFIFILTNTLLGRAQEIPLKIDYSPKSPDVSSLFDFSDVSVGYYTGSINTNIPLGNLSEGPLTTNVSLSYATSGNKVAERATWVGLGWNLNAAGIITREVRGKPDDSDNTLGFFKFLDTRNFDSIDDITALSESDKAALYFGLTSECLEAEPDVFNFRVGDLQGTFMFDWDGSLKVACNRKIEIDYTQQPNSYEISEWRITDDLGNKYVFSARETNQIIGLTGWSIVCNDVPYTTAWKLTSIEDHSSLHKIDFTYEEYVMEYPVEYTKQHTINEAGASGPISASSSGLKIVGSYLKSIRGNNSQNTIEFVKGNTARNDVTGTNLFPLGSIIIKDRNANIVDAFNFNYSNGGRLLLNNIKRIKDANSLDWYEFEYNSTAFPNDYNSYSIDHWGYYNGKSNSVPYPAYTTIIPSGSTVTYPGADKEPSSSHSEALVLKKIVYPTKGYSEFTYEGHDYSFIQDRVINNNEAIQIPADKFVSAYGNPDNIDELVQDTKYFDVIINTTVNTSNTNCDGGICKRKVSVLINALNLSDFAQAHTSPKLRIYDNNNQIIYQKEDFPFNLNYSNLVDIWLPEGSYRVVTETRNYGHGSVSSSNSFVYAALNWKNDLENHIEIKDVGGVRIKEVAEYDSDNTLLKRRTFQYRLNDYPNLSSGSIDVLPKYEDDYIYWKNIGVVSEIKVETIRYSGSLSQLGSNFGHVRYNEVTEDLISGADKIRKIYKYTHGDNDIISTEKPYPPAISKAYKKGLLESETLYRHSGGSFTPVQKNTFEYAYKELQIPALKVGFNINGEPSVSSSTSSYATAYYNSYIGYNQITNKKTETFFDSSTTTLEDLYTYDSTLNRMISSTRNTSNNELLSKYYTYPDTDDPSSINSLMTTKSIIGNPVKIKTSLNEELLLVESRLYKDYGNGLILPEFIKVSKGTDPIEDRVVYHSYDNLGNPLEVSQADGAHMVYLWGYDQQYPVAKIENATYSQVIATGVNLSVLNNLNSTDSQRTTELNKIRNGLANSLITTYLYKPLVGITSMTGPTGYTMTYEYDEFNRLKHVRDADGNILSENTYHYKNQ